MTDNCAKDPIAVVGIACRLPGATNPTEFWDLLVDGRAAISEIPPRFGADSTLGAKVGGFIGDIDTFDADFFGMSRHEALRLDPHHRLLLETSWEAVEDAGIAADRLAGTRTGVFAGNLYHDYHSLLRDAGIYDMHAVAGAGGWGSAAGRIAHFLDLRGPTLSLGAACATALMSVHFACRSIWSGDAEQAIVAEASLMFDPGMFFGLTEADLLSPSGRCGFADAHADGFVRAEGAVAVLLKPLSNAVRDGDRVYASILGSGVSNNGRSSSSFFATAVVGQEEMLRTALRDAGVSPADLDYVEAHGPGTPGGDTTELTALSRVLGEGRDPGSRCLVGSVKTNIGHTEGVAGLVGLLKVALALRERVVPATLNVTEPHPLLAGTEVPLELPVTSRPWPDRDRPGIAGVSAFGLAGTNVHVVLTEPPRAVPRDRPDVPAAALILPLSARHPLALWELAGAYADLLDGAPALDVCHSAGTRRMHHRHRIAVTGPDATTLAARLRELAAGELRPTDGPADGPRVVFVFPGQGSQWLGMGRELLATVPVFAARLRECDEALRVAGVASVLDRLLDDRPFGPDTEIQPVLWAVQLGLAEVWRSWGIEPDLVIGHSMGEVTAAAFTEALPLTEAAGVLCRRIGLMHEHGEPGAMVTVQLGEADAQRAIGRYADRVSVAVVNSDYSTVLSGEAEALERVIEPLRARGIFCRFVRAGTASHSARMEPVRTPLKRELAGIRPQRGQVPMHSTVFDRRMSGIELDAGYWMANLRERVRFGPAVGSLLRDEIFTVFVEISPHPVLITPVEDMIEATGGRAKAVGSLQRDQPELPALTEGLAALYTYGCQPRWDRVLAGGGFVPLPSYPWQRSRFWVDRAERPAPLGPTASPAPADDLVPRIALGAATVLSTTVDEIDPSRPLTLSGMDSLLAAKLRAWLQQELDLHIPVRDLLGAGSLADIAKASSSASTRGSASAVR